MYVLAAPSSAFYFPEVTARPDIIRPGRNMTEVLYWPEDVTLTLPCAVENPRHVTITWLKDGEPIETEARWR